jgi:hypothetical protein
LSLDSFSPIASDLPRRANPPHRVAFAKDFACVVGQINSTNLAVPRSSRRGASRSL